MIATVDIINDSDCPQIPEPALLSRWCDVALQCLGEAGLARTAKPVTLGVRIVDEQTSAKLNQQYRHKSYATNVLSFTSELPAFIASELEEIPLGDLVVCASVVDQEAQDQAKSLSDHWAHMLVHGILHLHGLDHESDDEAETMENLEIRILAHLGINNPYIDRSSVEA